MFTYKMDLRLPAEGVTNEHTCDGGMRGLPPYTLTHAATLAYPHRKCVQLTCLLGLFGPWPGTMQQSMMFRKVSNRVNAYTTMHPLRTFVQQNIIDILSCGVPFITVK